MSTLHSEFQGNLDPQLFGHAPPENYTYAAPPQDVAEQAQQPSVEDNQPDMSAMDLTFILQHNPQTEDPNFTSQFGINQVVHPNVDDAIVSFDTESGSFPRRTKNVTATQADPYAAAFLAHALGQEKWETFSARLFERRLGGPKARARGKGKKGSGDEADKQAGGASAIEFLVKVEVVKEVLRTFVPHPYNPLKSLSHPYAPAPTGQVTLTRSTVLALSGWSNTQFSYWARRSEAVAVLAQHDARLRAVAIALESRLRGEPMEDEIGADEGVTGKGLDAIVDAVKKRTGASQFLRGKHSSLDPFGVTIDGSDGERISFADQPLLVPTYQLQQSPWGTNGQPLAALPLPVPPSQNGIASTSTSPDAATTKSQDSPPSAATFVQPTSQPPSPPQNNGNQVPFDDGVHRFGGPPHKHGMDDSSRVEYFPVSDSRSFRVSDSRSEETGSTVQTRSSKRKLRSSEVAEPSHSDKRLRSSGPVQ